MTRIIVRVTMCIVIGIVVTYVLYHVTQYVHANSMVMVEQLVVSVCDSVSQSVQ